MENNYFWDHLKRIEHHESEVEKQILSLFQYRQQLRNHSNSVRNALLQPNRIPSAFSSSVLPGAASFSSGPPFSTILNSSVGCTQSLSEPIRLPPITSLPSIGIGQIGNYYDPLPFPSIPFPSIPTPSQLSTFSFDNTAQTTNTNTFDISPFLNEEMENLGDIKAPDESLYSLNQLSPSLISQSPVQREILETTTTENTTEISVSSPLHLERSDILSNSTMLVDEHKSRELYPPSETPLETVSPSSGGPPRSSIPTPFVHLNPHVSTLSPTDSVYSNFYNQNQNNSINSRSLLINFLPTWVIETISEDRKCCICLNAFGLGDNVRALKCLHYFHSHCIDPWLQFHDHCPSCRVSTFDDMSEIPEISSSERVDLPEM